MNRIQSFILGAVLMGFVALAFTAHEVNAETHRLMVFKEVGTMLLQGQNETEIIMNVKSTSDLSELRAAFDYYKESTK